MNYGEVRTQFKAILNRRDCTDALADTFLNQGMQRAQRELRVPAQEEESVLTVTSVFTGMPVPSDIISPIAMVYTATTGEEKKVTFLPVGKFLEKDMTYTGAPVYYTRIGSLYKFRPIPAEGTTLTLYYYGEFETFTGDTDETVLSAIAPDLLIYGALSYAADYFIDERSDKFENRYLQIKQALQDQAYDLEGEGAVVQPAYDSEY